MFNVLLECSFYAYEVSFKCLMEDFVFLVVLVTNQELITTSNWSFVPHSKLLSQSLHSNKETQVRPADQNFHTTRKTFIRPWISGLGI